MIGYNRIPKKWLTNLQEAEDMKLAYTSTSLNEAYQLSFKHALQMISRQGGEMNEDAVTIRLQEPKPVRLEQGFEKMIPVRRLFVDKHADPMVEFSFVGTAFALTGSINNITDQSYCAELNVNIDGQDFKVMKLPKEFKRRSQELCWAYQLDNREHHVILTWINPVKDGDLHCNIATIYSNPTAL